MKNGDFTIMFGLWFNLKSFYINLELTSACLSTGQNRNVLGGHWIVGTLEREGVVKGGHYKGGTLESGKTCTGILDRGDVGKRQGWQGDII